MAIPAFPASPAEDDTFPDPDPTHRFTNGAWRIIGTAATRLTAVEDALVSTDANVAAVTAALSTTDANVAALVAVLASAGIGYIDAGSDIATARGTDFNVYFWVVDNGTADPTAALSRDIIYEREAV